MTRREPSPFWHLPSGPERNAMREAYYHQLDDRTDWLVRFCGRHNIPLVDGVTARRCDDRIVLKYRGRSERLLINPPENVLRIVLAHLTRPHAHAVVESNTQCAVDEQ